MIALMDAARSIGTVSLLLMLGASVTYLLVTWPERRKAADRMIDWGLALLDEEGQP